jgi:hypothetical protein
LSAATGDKENPIMGTGANHYSLITPRENCSESDSDSDSHSECEKIDFVPKATTLSKIDRECVDTKCHEQDVLAVVTALQAGVPTRRTRVLAWAERARCWIMDFPSVVRAVESLTDAAAKRTPSVAKEIIGAASSCVLDEMHASNIAVKVFTRPEILLSQDLENHRAESPAKALEQAMIALRRGQPSFTVRTVAMAERHRQWVIHLWKALDHVGREVFLSPRACIVSMRMQSCAAITKAYEEKAVKRVLTEN